MTASTYVIVVMGVSGSGKSTFGPLLAQHFGCAFIEGDTLHSAENIARMRDGIPLSDEDRWPWLERIGEAAGAAARRDGHVVVACSALKKSYRDCIRDHTAGRVLFVLLDASTEELNRRMAARQDHYMPPSLLGTQQALLEIPRPEECARGFATSTGKADVLAGIIEWLDDVIEGAGSGQAGDGQPR